jgi:hypothetical protein
MKDGMRTDINIGLSGSKLKILNKGLIRKYSPGNYFKDRFKLQIEKQLTFSKSNFYKLSTPRIVRYTDEYFDMEYIPGESYNEFFNKCNKQDLDNIVNICIDYFEKILLSSESYTDSDIKSLLTDKFNKVKKESSHSGYINYITHKINSTEFNNIPKSSCHGDFTVANMIFFKGNISCIDFLDSYIETVLVDMVKLKQDIYYEWILDINESNLRIRQSFNYLWNKIYSKFKQYYNLEFTNFITILNWLRIEPYIKTDKQKIVLNNNIINSKYYEEFINSYSR